MSDDDKPMYVPSRSVAEAASWRLGSEMVRRHPDLQLSQWMFEGGLYDLLSIMERDVELLRLNRNGTIQGPWNRPHLRGVRIGWEEYLADDLVRFIERLEAAVGLTPPPGRLATSTPRVLTYRVIAALAAMYVLTPHPLVAVDRGDGEWYLGFEYRQPAAILEQETGHVWRFDRKLSISLPASYRANGRSISRTAVEMAKAVDLPLP